MKVENVNQIPIGLMTKFAYEDKCKLHRYKDVCEAIDRYRKAGLEINREWIEEQTELAYWYTNRNLLL